MLALATKPEQLPPSKPLVSVNAVQKTYFTRQSSVQAVASAIGPVARAPPPNPPEAAIPSRRPQGESARGDEASDNE